MYTRMRSALLAPAFGPRNSAAGARSHRWRFRGAQSKSVSNRQRAMSRPALAAEERQAQRGGAWGLRQCQGHRGMSWQLSRRAANEMTNSKSSEALD